MPMIDNSKILVITTHGFEQSELEFPRDQLRARGADLHVATLDGKPARGWDGGDWGRPAEADLRIAEARVEDYDALVIPGGQINPDLLRVESDVIALVKAFHHADKPIAAICHAPWVLVEAGITKGRDMTSYHSIRTDVLNSGATWHDKAVVAHNGMVTSRSPKDLEAFVAKIVEEIEEDIQDRKVA